MILLPFEVAVTVCPPAGLKDPAGNDGQDVVFRLKSASCWSRGMDAWSKHYDLPVDKVRSAERTCV